MIDRSIIAALIFTIGVVTPLVSTAIESTSLDISFHGRDFISPWVWCFNYLEPIVQWALLVAVVSYFLGKVFSYFYLTSRR